ncbi:hypothetical protein UY3_07158 [Chelonia mydas]|uniref:Myb/SANT-like DNA-binding domain-containing protein n=1 Tax=Chelonia mydas TaxID=8469 RepID=M7C593_CHEMY|nr:hypothetical protein UY3_07158 [Chelonia mydas]
MVGYRSKRFLAWTTVELLDLISIWGEEAVQSLLCLSCRYWDTYGQISQGLCEKGYDRDTLQCRAKIKEPRQVYHKVREANRHSSASPKTCQFYKELDVILGGDPTSIAKSPMDTLEGTEAEERGPNPEDKVIDEEVELDEDVQLPTGSPEEQPATELAAETEEADVAPEPAQSQSTKSLESCTIMEQSKRNCTHDEHMVDNLDRDNKQGKGFMTS